MRLKTEISADSDEEIVIRCKERTEKITALEGLIQSALQQSSELVLYIDNAEHYVEKNSILFFEAYDNKVYAHTVGNMYRTDSKLFELEQQLPPYFARVSKSVIANIRQISSLKRELTGNGELCFKNSEKKTYFSRSYHKQLKEKIQEIRL